MTVRLHLEHAKAASQTLAALGLAAAVLDQYGKVLAANALIEDLESILQWRSVDRLTLNDRNADEILAEALAQIAASGRGATRSFPVRDVITTALMVGHLLPIRFSARETFASAFVLMPVVAPTAPPLNLVMSLFDLTPAEARIARGLAAGKTVDDLADDNGVSPNTVRVQVRGVLEKTSCERQTDVVALLSGLSPVRGGRAG